MRILNIDFVFFNWYSINNFSGTLLELMSIDFVILAAGQGSRMKSSLPKIFQTIAGKPIVRYIIDTCQSISTNIIVVTKEDLVNHELLKDVKTLAQMYPKGTGDAVLQATPYLKSDYTIILCGDMPLIEVKHLEKLVNSGGNALMSMKLPDELIYMPYGRLLLNNGMLERIIEYKNANAEQRLIPFANAGLYKIQTSILNTYISEIQENPVTNEFYFTDLFEILRRNDIDVSVIQDDEYYPFHGINTMEDLANAEKIMQDGLRRKFLNNGVKLISPETTYFAFDTEIEPDVTIEQNVIIQKGVKIRKNSIIKAFSYISECEIMENVEVGPFARIRGGSKFMSLSSIGNFVEVKGSVIGENTKAKHLTYIGDTTIGSNSNIGAGTITCNYDGVNKHKTNIGNDVFIGSNSTLIAPVTIKDNTLVGAGSVINKAVPENSLAIARAKQENIPDGANRIWKAKGKKSKK